jgi:molybdopterin-guanine dinucleotide biosynthesis protein B
MVVSDQRWVLMHELRGEREPTLEEQIARVSPCDLLLVEGHKHHPLPKLEVWRKGNGKPLLHPNDAHIVAIASDVPLETSLPRLDINDHKSIEEFIVSYNGLR